MKHGQPELATMCHNAKSGSQAKYMSKGIKCDKSWDESPICRNIMKGLVVQKVKQVTLAREKLHHCWINGLQPVESVPNPSDNYWGSGLDKEATKHTDPKFWPGKNMLGQIYMEVAHEMFGEQPMGPPAPPRISAPSLGDQGLMDKVCEGPSVGAGSRYENPFPQPNADDANPLDNESVDSQFENASSDEEGEIKDKGAKILSKMRANSASIDRLIANERRKSLGSTPSAKLRAKIKTGHVPRSKSPRKKTIVSPRAPSVKRGPSSPQGSDPKQVRPDNVNSSSNSQMSSTSKVEKSNTKIS